MLTLMISISESKDNFNLSDRRTFRGIIFKATSIPVSVLMACFTFENEPTPTVLRILYGQFVDMSLSEIEEFEDKGGGDSGEDEVSILGSILIFSSFFLLLSCRIGE